MSAQSDPDYLAHDAVYRRRRASGAIGWSSHSDYVALLETVESLLPQAASNGARVLEIGCGAGNLSLLLAKRGWVMTAVDISPAAIEWAAERSAQDPAVEFRVDDVRELSTCGDARFDVVIDGHCLHCIIGDDRGRCLRSIRRVLKDRGVLLVNTMCGDVVDARLRETFDPATRVVSKDGRPTRYVGEPDHIQAEIVAAGFVIVHACVVPRAHDADQDTLVVLASKVPC
jgi:2-polyprenyl-3-methyl-5-hydroxy-6-metoxy-1,4-benzoquinol methylase